MIDHRRLVAVTFGIAAQLFQQPLNIGRRRLLAAVAARKRQISLEHAVHLVDVALHALDLGTVDQLHLELEAGQDRPQVVRDAGQHRGALLDRALDAGLHLHERLGRLADLAGAARPEVRHLAALAEAFGGLGQTQDRLDLVAQEQDGDEQQHERRADHPEQEDLRIRGIGGVAPGKHLHHGVIKLDPDLDQR